MLYSHPSPETLCFPHPPCEGHTVRDRIAEALKEHGAQGVQICLEQVESARLQYSVGQAIITPDTMTLEHLLQELAQGEEFPKHSLLVYLSNASSMELEHFRNEWPSIPADRRRKLMDRLVDLAGDNLELDFNAIFRCCLTDENPEVRELAVSGLWECDDRNLVAPLMALLKDDPWEHVRAAAAVALGKFCSLAETGKLLPRDGDHIKDLLFSILENQQETVEVRRRALEAAACFNTQRIRELIQWAYSGTELKLRISSLYAMGKTGDQTWMDILIAETESNNPAMQYEAAGAFAEIGEEEAIPYLIPLLHADDLQVQMAAIKALGTIGGSLAERTLRLLLKEDDESLQEAVQAAMELVEMGVDPVNFESES